MSDWSAGYVSDVGYTYGYYTELNPLRVRLAFLNQGLACPQFGTACDLGFGQGVSVNIHAAASPTQWYGTDFSPGQAAFAQELAAASGAGPRLYDEAFADFAARPDLPDFDFIGVHGIWSWVSDQNRAVIVDFVRRKLKVGGVLYISYNTMPGWASMAPLRDLLLRHRDVMGVPGSGIVANFDAAVAFADRLLATGALYGKANPDVRERLAKLQGQNSNYLVHEYFNRNWLPMHVATMAQWLEPAKVSYACSAHYLDHIDAVNLSGEQQAFLKAIPDPMFRESARDMIVNQPFRRDYWIKGARRLTPLEQAEALRSQPLVLTTHRPDVSLKVGGALGEATLSAAAYGPILDALADHSPRTLGQIEQAVQGQVSFAQVQQAVVVLAGAGHLAAVQEPAVSSKARKHSEKLNAHLLNLARGSNDVSFLASPVTGGGVFVGRFQQLFLLAIAQGKKSPSEWARHAWDVLAVQRQKLVKDGRTLETPDENLAELNAQAQSFAETRLAILRAVQVA